MGKIIKLPNGSELTEEQLAEIIQQQEADKITDQVAEGLIASYKKGEGMVLQIAIPLQMEDLKQIIEPEHPLLPMLIAHMACEQVKQRAFGHLTMVCRTIAEKMGRPLPTPPGEPAAVPVQEEVDPGQISAPADVQAIGEALAALTGGQLVVGGQGDLAGSLGVKRADGSQD